MQKGFQSKQSIRTNGNSGRRAAVFMLSMAATAWSSQALGSSGSWNGSTDGNWSTVANWSAQPGASTGNTNGDGGLRAKCQKYHV